MNTRTPQMYALLASLLGVLSVATVAAYLLKARRPGDPPIENLNARIRSWWILILAGGAALLAGKLAVTLLFAAISFLSLREFLPRAPFSLLAIPALATQYACLMLGWERLFLWGVPSICLAALLVSAGARAGSVCWALLICVYGISYVPALMTLPIPGDTGRAALLMVFAVLIAQTSDICQYIWGKLAGRHLLIPRLSPSKTVEGLAGGILSAMLLGAVLWRLTPFTVVVSEAMSFLIAVTGFLGGLALSAIKRHRGIKDWSNLIPGHGGILDRVDSLYLSAPVLFHVTRHLFSER